MFDYIRSWWLLNRISSSHLKDRARTRKENKVTIKNGEAEYTGTALVMEKFLEKRAERYMFGILKILPEYFLSLRIEKDRRLLQRLMNKQLAQYITHPDLGTLISTLPEGDFFAQPMNGFAGFLKEYREAFIVIILVLSAINLNSKSAQAWVSARWHEYLQSQASEQKQVLEVIQVTQ